MPHEGPTELNAYRPSAGEAGSMSSDVQAYREWATREIELAKGEAEFWRLHLAKTRKDRDAARRYCYWAFLALSKVEWCRSDEDKVRRCPLCWGRYPDHMDRCSIGVFFTLAEARFRGDEDQGRIPRYRRPRTKGEPVIPALQLLEDSIGRAFDEGCRTLVIGRTETLDIQVTGASEDGVVEWSDVWDRLGIS